MLREAHGLKLGEVAKQADVGASFLSLIESNDRNASRDTLEKLAKVLKVPASVLLKEAGFLPKPERREGLAVEIRRSLDDLEKAEQRLKRKLGLC